ncbi:hypothetical protein PIB30_066662 [Stylosanthes scabra]|uniref:Uncharacterized protein n=1 Tax=Stylosanthes scabra TaxID=79078 RepID=A0ABU6TM43_9FABA|nr:hypothetical protein [Stylosanthes scabra]
MEAIQHHHTDTFVKLDQLNSKKFFPGKTVIQEARIAKNIARNPETLFSNTAINDRINDST